MLSDITMKNTLFVVDNNTLCQSSHLLLCLRLKQNFNCCRLCHAQAIDAMPMDAMMIMIKIYSTYTLGKYTPYINVKYSV